MAARPTTLARPVWWISFMVGSAFVGSILIFGSRFLIPLAIAVILWLLINAIGRTYGKVGIGGLRLPPALCRLLAVLTMLYLGWLIVSISASNIAQVRAAAPGYQANLTQLVARALGYFGIERTPTVTEVVGRFDLVGLLGSLTAGLGSLVGSAGLVMLYVAFFMLEQSSFQRKLDALFTDPERTAGLRQSLVEIERRIEGYLWIKTLVSLLTAFLCYVVLATVGVDFASFWALLIFLFNFIPNIGSLFAVLLPTVLTLLQFGDLGVFLLVLASLSAIQAVIGNLIEPRLMGRTLNLSPLVIILSLTFWGIIWGVAGMFLCVPLTALLAIVLSKFEPTRPVAILLSSDGRLAD
ncbi:MAG: AI-2E family transporter [Geminicoccaceae bacterium]